MGCGATEQNIIAFLQVTKHRHGARCACQNSIRTNQILMRVLHIFRVFILIILRFFLDVSTAHAGTPRREFSLQKCIRHSIRFVSTSNQSWCRLAHGPNGNVTIRVILLVRPSVFFLSIEVSVLLV